MFESIIRKIVTFFYDFPDLNRKILYHVFVALLLFGSWIFLEHSFFNHDHALHTIDYFSHYFFRAVAFVSVSVFWLIIKEYRKNKRQYDELMDDDPFTKIEELADMLDEREEALRKSEARLRGIIDTAPVGIGLIDENRDFIELNDYFCNLLEYDCDYLLGKSAKEIYASKEEYDRVGDVKYKQIEHRGYGRIETKMKKSTGELVDVILTSTYLNGGKVDGTIFSVLDISELKRTTADLALDEERLESLFNLSQIDFLSEEELISYALEECVRLTKSEVGYFHFAYDKGGEESDIDLGLFTWSKETTKKCTAKKVDHYPLEKAGIWADCVRLKRPVIHNDYTSETSRKGVPEGHFPIIRHMSVPVYDDKGKLVGVVGVGNKVEEYLDADARQLQLFMTSIWRMIERNRKTEDYEKLFDNLLTGAVVGKVIKNKNDKVSDYEFSIVNKMFESYTGKSKREVEGKTLFEVFPEADKKLLEVYDIIVSSDDSFYFEYYAENLNKWFEISAYSPTPDHFVAVFNDITSRKEFEKALKRSEETFRKATEFNVDGIILVDKDGKIRYVNNAVEKMTGKTEEELNGTKFGYPISSGEITYVDIIGPDDKPICAEMRVSSAEMSNETFYILSLRELIDSPDECFREFSDGNISS